MGTGTVDLGSAPALAWVTILLDASIKGAVILLIAGALSALLRRTSAAARHLVWLLAVASLIALPALSLALPAWRLPILPQELAAVEPIPTPTTETSAPPEALSQPAIPPEPVTVTPLVSIAESLPEPEAPAPTHWSAWLLIIWGTGATAVFLWLLAGTVSVWRTARRAQPVPEGSPWAVLLKELAGRLGVKGAARLLQSEGVSVPMIWGLVRPLVLLPADGERWSEERRRIVLLHELAHIRRKDCLTQMVAQLACTIYWFNPLAWLAARQMRRERERACDDLVLAAGLKASSYAGHLLEIARSARASRCAAIAGVAMARPSNIEGRLLAILDAKRSRRALTRLTFALALIAVTCALLPLAAIRPTARAAGASQKVEAEGAVGKPQTEEEKPATVAPATTRTFASSEPAFGPVIERVVNDDGAGSDFLIDLDTGRLFTPPGRNELTSAGGLMEWLQKNGIDAGAETYPAGPGLGAIDMGVYPIANEYWDRAADSVPFHELPRDHSPAVMMTALGGLPRTYMFRTREGGTGILQIVEVETTEKPEYVKIRYKMLKSQGEAAAPRAASQPVDAAEPALGSRGAEQETVATKAERTPGAEAAAEIHLRLYEFSGPLPKQVTEHLGLAPVEGGMIATVLTGAKLRTLVDALKVLPHVQLVWSPKLTLNDTQRSQLATPTHENFVKDVRRVTKDGEERIEPVIETLTWGRLLDARPTISSDRRFVELEFGFTDSRLERFDTKEKLGHRIQVPVLETTELKTAVNIPSGGAVAVSGLRLGERSLLLVISVDVVEPRTDTTVPPMVLRAEPAFGPLMERVVNDPDWSERDAAIDLDTGTLFSTPAGEFGDDLMAAFQWAVAEGIDAVSDSSGKTLRGLGMVVKAVPNERWDAITPEEVAADADLLEARTRSPLTPIEMHTTTPPASYLFRTREGGTGILQITGFTAGQRGVRIRYKMLKSGGVAAAPRRPTRAVLPDNAFFDLATGRLEAPPEVDDDSELFAALEKRGRGDLVYSEYRGWPALTLIRGARADRELPLMPEFPDVPVPYVVVSPPWPHNLQVTTREGRRYAVSVLSAGDEGCLLEYVPLAAGKREEPGQAAENAFIPDAEQARREKLQRIVTFSFDDTPLEDVVDFIRQVAEVNMVVDQRVLAAAGPGGYRITLSLTDVPIADALDFITDLVDLKWTIRRGVVFISDAKGLQARAEERKALEERRKARAEIIARDKALGEKLQRKVSLSFADTPLVDVVDFIRQVAEVNMVVDQRVLAAAGPGGYRVSLALTDVPLEDALDFILDLVELKWTIRRGVVFISDAVGVQAEPEAEEKGRLAELRRKRGALTAAEKAVLEKFQRRKVTFDFTDTPLEDVVDFMRRVADVSFIVDQRVLTAAGPGGYRITLSLTDIPLEDALDFITDLVDLEWTIRRGVVFISDVQGVQAEAFMRIYDVRDLIGRVTDFAGPRFDVVAPGPPPRAEVDEAELKEAEEKGEALVKRIQEEVEPETWKLDHTSIVHRQGNLIIRNADHVHQKIQRFLEERRQSSLFSLRPVTEPGKSYAEKMVDLRTDQEVWLSKTCIVSAASLVPKPEVSVRLQPGQPAAIEVEITADAASRLAQWTKAHVRQQMAVVCDGEVWSVATAAEAIAGAKLVLAAPDAGRARRFATKLQEYFGRRLKEGRRSP